MATTAQFDPNPLPITAGLTRVRPPATPGTTPRSVYDTGAHFAEISSGGQNRLPHQRVTY
jgi:hypothetical protein